MKSPTSTGAFPLNFSPNHSLPPYLCRTEPMEPEDIPLQLALITMEVATLRVMLQRLAVILDAASLMMRGPGLGLNDGDPQNP
jgi:hypothetical protein